jgi:hypothetical protein
MAKDCIFYWEGELVPFAGISAEEEATDELPNEGDIINLHEVGPDDAESVKEMFGSPTPVVVVRKSFDLLVKKGEEAAENAKLVRSVYLTKFDSGIKK